jgi:hypothetical protein
MFHAKSMGMFSKSVPKDRGILIGATKRGGISMSAHKLWVLTSHDEKRNDHQNIYPEIYLI